MRLRALLLFVITGCSPAQSKLPTLAYQVVPDWPQMPAGWNFRETPGIAAGREHVYVIHRGEHPIMEFDGEGRFIQSFGDGLFERPHPIRIDAEGNIWTVDDGSHVVLKMDRLGRIQMVLGRWRSSTASPPYAPGGAAPSRDLRGIRDDQIVRFNRPTDVAWAAYGDIYVSDGYGNSRVVKFSRDGQLLKIRGTKGRFAARLVSMNPSRSSKASASASGSHTRLESKCRTRSTEWFSATRPPTLRRVHSAASARP